MECLISYGEDIILKNIIKILLVLMLVSSVIFSTQFSHVVEASTTGYYELLSNEVQSIRVINQDDIESFGVVYVKLADFDKDGDDELYIVTQSTAYSGYEERLYEGDKLIYENNIPGPGNGRGVESFRIGEGKKGIYFNYSYSEGGSGSSGMISQGETRNTISILEKGQVKEILNYSTREFTYDMEVLSEYIENEEAEFLTEEGQALYENWDGISTEYSGSEYYINNKEVSKETYETKVNPYDSVDWEEIISGDYPVVDSEVVVNQVLNQLEESLKPKNMGEDLKDSMDQELKASLVDWLMYSQFFRVENYKIGERLSDQDLFGYLFIQNMVGGLGEIESENSETVDSSTFPKDTYLRMNGQDVDQFLSIYLGQSFTEEDFVVDLDMDGYPVPHIKQNGDYYFGDFGMSIHTNVLPYIRGIYEIAKDVYYIDFTEYELFGREFVNEVWNTPRSQVFDLIPEAERNVLPIASRGYAVMKKSVIDGEYQWTLIERDTTGGTFDEAIIEQYKKQKLAPTQIELKLEDSDKYSTIKGYLDVIQKEIATKELNEQDKSLLTQYITVALQKLNMQSLEASGNTLILLKDQLEIIMNEMQSSELQFVETLALDKLSLPKRIERIHRVNVDQLNMDKPVKVQLTEDLLEGIDIETQGADSLYISFDGSSMGMVIKYEQLQSILQEHGEVTFIFTYSDNQVEVAFEIKSGTIEKLTSPIQIIMPAETETSMVYVEDELWGGQHIEETNSLVFETKGSGTYTIRNNEVSLSDIDKLTDEQQQAITFLVTRGFFDIEDNQFEESKTISRNDFAKTLVRLFFSLDKDAQTTFIDVKENSPYYPFIASGQQNEIIYGYKDNMFKGDNLISISHVLSLSGRTLANKKGYDSPTNAEDYLEFLDADSIDEEARGEIALSVREGLIDQRGLLEPQRQITRLEAAEILYKLYMLLYEQPLYTVEAEVKSAIPFYMEYKWPLISVGAGLIAVLGSVMFIQRRKLKLESVDSLPKE